VICPWFKGLDNAIVKHHTKNKFGQFTAFILNTLLLACNRHSQWNHQRS